MKVFKGIRQVMLTLLAATALAASAGAATISNNQTKFLESFGGLYSGHAFGPPEIQIPDNQNRNGSYTLQQFNGALGTLNSVRIEFNQSVDSTIEDTGGGCAAGFSACAVELARTFTQSGAVSLGTANGTASTIIDPSTVNCDIGLTPNSCFLSSHARNSPYTEAIEFNAPGDVANFVGAGTFDVTTELVVSFLATLSPEGDYVESFGGYTWSGTATVIYDYTAGSVVAMPAPAGAAFLLIGLAALARRKRAA